MATRLLIRIAPDGRLSWLAPATATRGNGAPPADLVAAAREIIALVPVEQVLLTRAELPPGSAAKLARVLPYALEDQVLDPVDALHFARGSVDAEGRHRVAVMARATLAGWLQSLRDVGIQADAMLPDALAVPRVPRPADNRQAQEPRWSRASAGALGASCRSRARSASARVSS